ncbi:unnamed protein product [Paramecium octaurelia]|uniref:Transmembrane protein n=1 Tax=Paramecium octaurelia TaxID=43137 RepID=A0A8S1TC33_PAROT|nr:unnamed protein product [Paramecium octaurelia]
MTIFQTAKSRRSAFIEMEENIIQCFCLIQYFLIQFSFIFLNLKYGEEKTKLLLLMIWLLFSIHRIIFQQLFILSTIRNTQFWLRKLTPQKFFQGQINQIMTPFLSQKIIEYVIDINNSAVLFIYHLQFISFFGINMQQLTIIKLIKRQHKIYLVIQQNATKPLQYKLASTYPVVFPKIQFGNLWSFKCRIIHDFYIIFKKINGQFRIVRSLD